MDIQGLQLLESCAYTWLFDAATHLFRRTPRTARVGLDALTAWTPYHRLEIDDARSCFVVALDDEGTRRLRAWIHIHPCGRCSPVQVVVRSARHPILRPFGGWPRTGDAA